MAKPFVIPTIAFIAILAFPHVTRGQQPQRRWPGAVYDSDKVGEKPRQAPRRSLSGIWDPAKNAADGIQANGPKAVPSDGKPEHELPFTTEGRKAFLANKPTFGTTMVAS